MDVAYSHRRGLGVRRRLSAIQSITWALPCALRGGDGHRVASYPIGHGLLSSAALTHQTKATVVAPFGLQQSLPCPALLCPALPCSALLCPVGYLAFTARPSMHGTTLQAIRDAGSLNLLVRFISPVGISSNSQVLLLHAPAHSTFPPFNFLIGRLPLFSGRAVYFSHDDAG
jgi:hypothetical protein